MNLTLTAPLKYIDLADFEELKYRMKTNEGTILGTVVLNDFALTTKEYSLGVGLIASQEIKSNYKMMCSFDKHLLDGNESLDTLNAFVDELKTFTQALWMVKDHAISIPFSTFYSQDQKQHIGMNFSGIYTSKSDGEILPTFFDEKDFAEACYWYDVIMDNSIKSISKKNEESIEYNGNIINRSVEYFEESTSFERAFSYLQITRESSFIPAKIAFYITILENLLAVKGDNAHKVGERLATLICKPEEDAFKVFKDIKKAYDFRSNFVHGSSIKHANDDHFENIKLYSLKLDDYVRRAIKKLIADYSFLNYSDNKKDDFISFVEANENFVKLVLNK